MPVKFGICPARALAYRPSRNVQRRIDEYFEKLTFHETWRAIIAQVRNDPIDRAQAGQRQDAFGTISWPPVFGRVPSPHHHPASRPIAPPEPGYARVGVALVR